MKDEYIIINKTKWLEVLENNKKPAPHWDGMYISESQNARVELIEDIISQSTPLIPEIEKSFDAGRIPKSKKVQGYGGKKTIEIFTEKKDYISNLKLDI